jgi:hypothetical protein
LVHFSAGGEVRAIFGLLVNVFETDPRWLWRVLAAGGFGLLIAVGVVLYGEDLGSGAIICILIMLPMFCLIAGCLLATIDTIRKRIESGAAVNRLSRVLFGGLWSVWLWFAVLLVVGFPLAILIGILTWKR